MTTLYDLAPKVWDRIAALGRPSVAAMARHFSKAADMDRALGITRSTAHYLSGRKMPSMMTERRASSWLDRNVQTAPVPAPEPSPEPEPDADSKALFLICPFGAVVVLGHEN